MLEYFRRFESGDRGQGFIEFLYFHQARLRNGSLGKPRGTLVRSQHVRIAVLAQAAGGAGFKRIEPGSRADPGHPVTDAVIDHEPRKTGSAVIMDADNITMSKSASTGLRGIDRYRFPARIFDERL